MDRFSKDGRLIIPIGQRKSKTTFGSEDKVRYIIEDAYCPTGCNIMEPTIKINGYPGLKIGFKRADCEGEFVISAIEGDFSKVILHGKLLDGVKDELFCPHCGALFQKLVNCNCSKDADMVVIGLTPVLDYNNAITFCNVTGCSNGSFIKSGDAIRHVRLAGKI